MIFRYARHSANLGALTIFYTRILGLEVVGGFEGHDGINGVMIGHPGESWHLEFTESDEPPRHTFDDEDNLVFYPTSREEFDRIMERIRLEDLQLIRPRNPYWDNHGVMILDPDGYRVVISTDRIPA